jgi:hypothetical protein
MRLLRIGLFLVALAGAAALTGWHEVADTTSQRLGLVQAGLVLLGYLLVWPPTRPATDAARPGFLGLLGRLLAALGWTITAAAAGAGGYLLMTTPPNAGFTASMAALPVLITLVRPLWLAGRQLSGFPTDWSRYRGLALIPLVVNTAAAAAVAGFSTVLARVAWLVFSWVPVHFFLLLHHLWHNLWLTVLVCVLLAPVWILLLGMLEVPVQFLAARLLGRHNAIGEWLDDALPARLRIGRDGLLVKLELGPVHLHYTYQVRNTVTYTSSTSTGYISGTGFGGHYNLRGHVNTQTHSVTLPRHTVTREHVTPRVVRRLARYERPMAAETERALTERIARAALPYAYTPHWYSISVHYRAVGDHEEVTVVTGFLVDKSGELTTLDGSGSGKTHELDVADFPELEALRQLREAGYRAGRGTPFAWRLSLRRKTRHARVTAGPDDPRPWSDLTWRPIEDEAEPRWRAAPTSAQKSVELQRFPVVRGLRPEWLR